MCRTNTFQCWNEQSKWFFCLDDFSLILAHCSENPQWIRWWRRFPRVWGSWLLIQWKEVLVIAMITKLVKSAYGCLHPWNMSFLCLEGNVVKVICTKHYYIIVMILNKRLATENQLLGMAAMPFLDTSTSPLVQHYRWGSLLLKNYS